MLAALARALGEQGYEMLTIKRISERAGVSRKTFYEHFEDRNDCLVAAYDDVEQRVWAAAAEAVAGIPPGDWPGRVHAALAAVLDFVTAEPDTARLFTLEARAAGPVMAARHAAALDRLAALLRAGNRARDLPEAAKRTLVANVAALIGSYVIGGAGELLPDLEPQLAEHLLSPYRNSGLSSVSCTKQFRADGAAARKA